MWHAESEYQEFLQFLEKRCAGSEHLLSARDGSLRFAYSAFQTSIGKVDVFRYQRREAWDTGAPPSVAVGQGMFSYHGEDVTVTDLNDSGYKYVLPYETASLYSVKVAPPLPTVIDAIRAGTNISSSLRWHGP